MRKFYLLLCGGVAFCFIACEVDSVADGNRDAVSESHAVSETRALENLANALAVIDGSGTRASGKQRTVQRVTPVFRADASRGTTRSSDVQSDTLAYIVEFGEGEGSAILAADNRLEPVVAIYDEYVATEEDLRQDAFEPDAWRIPENLYCEEEDEYYLGDINAGGDGGSAPLFRETQLIKDYLGKNNSGEPSYDVEKERYIVEHIRPMLTTKWHQQSPFSDLTPGNYPAGCVAIAVAQIMAYHEYPRDFCNWASVKKYEEMKEKPNHSVNIDYLVACDQLALMAVRIGQGCDMKYNYFLSGESFTTPIKAKRFLRNIGYYGTKREIGYDSGLIVSNLKAGCPVFIGAMTEKCYGHAWVIDGYATYEIVVDTYAGRNLISRRVDKSLLLHCNWGWDGKYDGYFASKAFDAVKGCYLADDNAAVSQTRGANTKNYTWWFRIVTYNKP